MNERYAKAIKKWNEIFAEEVAEGASFPEGKTLKNKVLDQSMEWLCQNSSKILDFGCGTGTLLFYCALKGTQHHVGIDLSLQGITLADKRKTLAKTGEYQFIHGGVEKVENFAEDYFDGIILSNIVDNLYPKDAMELLTQVKRVLKTGGRILMKTNPYITTNQQKKWGIKVIEGNLLDDGFVLWNQRTRQWKAFLEGYFTIEKMEEIHYKEHDTTNRLFYLLNNKG